MNESQWKKKEGKVNGEEDIISHRTYSLPGAIGESLRYLEYCIPSAMIWWADGWAMADSPDI